jgi:nucleoside-diphosphate-sugar epimerase
MKVFVTGGSGYIGQATIRALRAHGHEVTALARSEASAAKVRAAGATPVTGELTDADTLRAAAADADAAIHLASDLGGDTAASDLAAATAIQDGLGSGTYVHTGGVWVLGNTDGVVDESAPQSAPPITSWRAANEAAVLGRVATGGHPVLVMPGVVYGDEAGLIAGFLSAPAREGRAHWIGEGTNHWSVVHVEDLAELYVLALTAPAGSVYAGVDGQTPTMRELAEAASAAAGRPGTASSVTLEQAREEFGPLADAFALDQQVSGDRARRELGWSPAARSVLTELG